MSSVPKSMPSASPPALPKSWIARHKILTFLGALFIAIVAGFYLFGWPLVKWRFHALFVSSLDEIRHNPAATERLGEPISVPLLPLPSGGVYTEGDHGEAHFYFTVVGPKDKAQAISIMRMVNGQWGFTQLKLDFPDKQQLDIAQAIQQRGGDDTPKFDPSAKQPEVKSPDLPVDIKLPDLPSMPQK